MCIVKPGKLHWPGIHDEDFLVEQGKKQQQQPKAPGWVLQYVVSTENQTLASSNPWISEQTD